MYNDIDDQPVKSVLDIALGKFPLMGAKIIGNMPFPLFDENFKEGKIVNAELKDALLKLVHEFEKELYKVKL